MERDPQNLRSYRWFGPDDLRSFGHRSRAKQMGFDGEDYEGKPVIGILNTWSDLSVCHTHFRERAEQIKRGVWQAGGFPVEVPVMMLSETFMKPTTMLYRNLAAMEVEEVLRCPQGGSVGADRLVEGVRLVAPGDGHRAALRRGRRVTLLSSPGGSTWFRRS